MKLSQLIEQLPYGTQDVEITNVTNDSRKVTEGTLFVCINGGSVDGHKFAASAANNGAAAILTEYNVGVDCQVIVKDTRIAYADACAAFFSNPARKLKIIGVTGTNGKTTTTFLLKQLLESFGKKVGLIGTIHNMVCDEIIETANTTPDAFELHRLFKKMVDAGCEYVVMEVSSHALDQKRVYGIDFEVGVFTNLTRDHLDYHKTMENYLEAKKKLFYSSKYAVINADDSYAKQIIDGTDCKVVTFSVNGNDGDYLAKGINYKPNSTTFELLGSDDRIGHIRTNTPGKFSVYNAVSAACTAICLGFDFDEVVKNLSMAHGIRGRAEVVDTGRDFTVIVDYAHTPDGLENILNAMNEIKKGRTIIVFGCGGDRDKTKRPIMGETAARLADYCIVTSDNPRTEDPGEIIKEILVGMKNTKTPYKVIENRAEAIKYAIDIAKKDDIIVLAGKGHENYQIIGTQKHHFDDKEQVLEALK